MKWSIFVLFFTFLSFASQYASWEGIEYTISDPSITVEWDCAPNAVHYDVSIVMEANPETEYPLPTVTECKTTINQPRSGHFFIKVQACNNTECSGWYDSRNDSTATSGYQKGWKIYWKLQPPGPPIIIKHVISLPKDNQGNIIIPAGGLKAGWTGKVSRIRLVQATSTCDTSHLKDGFYYNSNNPSLDMLGLLVFANSKIVQYYLFPEGQRSDWIHLYIKFAQLNLNPCVPNNVSVQSVTTSGISEYLSNPVCYGVGCAW